MPHVLNRALLDQLYNKPDSRQLANGREAITRWREGGPSLFAIEALNATPLDWQLEASRLLVEKRRLSLRSGHGVGKSAFLAWTALWFLTCYFPAKIPVTAPTAHQLEDILWAELAKWHRQMASTAPSLAQEFEWTSERFFLKNAPEESFAAARTARQENPEALQGFHSEHLLFLIDEASGVPEAVFHVAEGALSTPGAYVLMASNPTRESGYFYDSHHKLRSHWGTLHVNAETCSIVSPEYVSEMRTKYGTESAVYKIRVQGEFADSLDGVIPLALCLDAKAREVKPIESAPILWGLDVARFGDDATALAKRQGNIQLEPTREWYGRDLMQTAGLIKMEYDALKRKPASILVDVIGLGAGVVDRLREQGLPVVGVNVAESPAVQDRYMRLRDEIWFRGREWLEARDCKLADDDPLIAELTSLKYVVNSNGRIKVESKDEAKKRGIGSPNRADAWLLTFALPGIGSMPTKIKYSSRGIV